MEKATLHLLLLLSTVIIISFVTKSYIDDMPQTNEEHPVATGYYRTNTWLCDVDIDGKSFPVKTELDNGRRIYSYDFPSKQNEEVLLKDGEGHVHICVPLSGHISE